MERKTFLTMAVAAAAGLSTTRLFAATTTTIEVYKEPQCGCCEEWVKHLRSNGFDVKVNQVLDTAPYRAKAGIPAALASCHTAFVDGYAVEGHVPAADIKRLLAERAAAKALVVPGMPQTSPGMDAPHGDAWNALLLSANGSTTVYRSYPAK